MKTTVEIGWSRRASSCWRKGNSTWTSLRGLLEAGRIAGPHVHDARIAALCLAHGVRELWTADRDFSRFPSLTTTNPLTESTIAFCVLAIC